MICPLCHGTRYLVWIYGGVSLCECCGGVGHIHCCEGDCSQPEPLTPLETLLDKEGLLNSSTHLEALREEKEKLLADIFNGDWKPGPWKNSWLKWEKPVKLD